MTSRYSSGRFCRSMGGSSSRPGLLKAPNCLNDLWTVALLIWVLRVTRSLSSILVSGTESGVGWVEPGQCRSNSRSLHSPSRTEQPPGVWGQGA